MSYSEDDGFERKLQVEVTRASVCERKADELVCLKRKLERAMGACEWDAALCICKSILEKTVFKFDGTFHFICGFIYERGFGNYEAAERHYRVALQIDGRNERFVRYYARASRRLGKYRDSAQMYCYGLELRPKSQAMLYEYAYLLWLSQKYTEALAQLRICLRLAGARSIDKQKQTIGHSAHASMDSYSRMRRKTIRGPPGGGSTRGGGQRTPEDSSSDSGGVAPLSIFSPKQSAKRSSYFRSPYASSTSSPTSSDSSDSTAVSSSSGFGALFGLSKKRKSKSVKKRRVKKQRTEMSVKKKEKKRIEESPESFEGEIPLTLPETVRLRSGNFDDDNSDADDNEEEEEDDVELETEETLDVANENVFWLFGRILCELERYKEAERYLIEAMHIEPSDVGYMVDYMVILVNSGRHVEALKEFMYARHVCCGDREVIGCEDRPSTTLLRSKKSDRERTTPPLVAAVSMTGDDLMTLKMGLAENYRKMPDNCIFSKRMSFNVVYLQSVYGYVLSCLGRVSEATAVFTALVSACEAQHCSFYEVHFYYAMHLHYSCKELRAAVRQYVSAMVVEPNWAATHYHLAVVCYQLAMYRCALFWLNEAHERNAALPLVANGYVAIGQRLSAKLRAVGEFDLDSAVVSEELFHAKAVKAYGARDWDLAGLLFLQLTLVAPKNQNYHHNMAMVLQYGFSDVRGAEKYFKSSIKCSSCSHPDILRHYAQLLVAERRLEDANSYYALLFKLVDEYNEEVSVASGSGEAVKGKRKIALTFNDYLNYGRTLVLKQKGATQKHVALAIKHLTVASELKADDWRPPYHLAKAHALNGHYHEAVQCFQMAVSMHATDAELWCDYASALWYAQDYGGAQKALNRCLTLGCAQQTTEKAYMLYGVLLQDLEDFDKAEKFVVQCLRVHQPNLKKLFPEPCFEDVTADCSVNVRYLAELMLIKIRKNDLDSAKHIHDFALCLLKKQSPSSFLSDEDTFGGDWYLDCVFAIWLSQSGAVAAASSLFHSLATSKEDLANPCFFISFYYAQHLHYVANEVWAAKQQYEDAVAIEDNWALCHWHYAEALFKLSLFKEAKSAAQMARKLCDALPAIGRGYHRLMAALRSQLAERITPPGALGLSDSDGDGRTPTSYKRMRLGCEKRRTPSRDLAEISEGRTLLKTPSHRGVASGRLPAMDAERMRERMSARKQSDVAGMTKTARLREEALETRAKAKKKERATHRAMKSCSSGLGLRERERSRRTKGGSSTSSASASSSGRDVEEGEDVEDGEDEKFEVLRRKKMRKSRGLAESSRIRRHRKERSEQLSSTRRSGLKSRHRTEESREAVERPVVASRRHRSEMPKLTSAGSGHRKRTREERKAEYAQTEAALKDKGSRKRKGEVRTLPRRQSSGRRPKTGAQLKKRSKAPLKRHSTTTARHRPAHR